MAAQAVRWSAAPVAAASLAICSPHLHCALHRAQEELPIRVVGATSLLDLQSLTPLSVADCGRLQLGVPHWATSEDYSM